MKKIIYILLLALVLTACGKAETSKKVAETEKIEKEDVKEDVETTEESEQSETPENSTPTPEITQSGSTQPTVTKTTMYAKSNVNVRSGAGTSNAQIGSLTKGQEVTEVGEENGWSKIEYNGTTGYVNSNYLSLEKVEAGNTANNSNATKPNSGNSNTNNSSLGNAGSSNNSGTSTPVHEHTWTEVTEEKITYYAWRTLCNVCREDLTDMSSFDMVYHVGKVCGGSYAAYHVEVDYVTDDFVKTPVVTGYKCECGATKKKIKMGGV